MQTPPLPPPPNEKCNLPRGSVLGRFRLPKGTYYYWETLKFTTDFMSGLRLDMSDKQNVLCLSESTPPPSSLLPQCLPPPLPPKKCISDICLSVVLPHEDILLYIQTFVASRSAECVSAVQPLYLHVKHCIRQTNWSVSCFRHALCAFPQVRRHGGNPIAHASLPSNGTRHLFSFYSLGF